MESCRKLVDILGCPVDDLTREEAVNVVGSFIEAGVPRQISVVNASKLYLMSRDPNLSRIVRSSDMIVSEWSILWASHMLNRPLRAFVGGLLLLVALLPAAQRAGWRIYFLGAQPEVIDRLKAKLAEDYPELQVAGAQHGYFSQTSESEVVRSIADAHVDVLFVGMGSPRQEGFIDRNRTAMHVPATIGVGGSFDVIAGLRRDAPTWARGHGLEWAFRLSQDPNKWKRYAVTNPWFVWRVLRARGTRAHSQP